MEPEKALQFIIQRLDTISGFTPPQVREMDQAFQSLAELVVADKAAKDVAKAEPEAGES